MEIETLYNMTKEASKGAERALENKNYQGYPAYINEYNRLLKLTIDKIGEEAEKLFSPINLGKHINPSHALPTLWGSYLERSSARLTSLTAYLNGKLGNVDSQVQSIIDLIEAKLRPSIYEDPQKEKDVQNVIETILRARSIDYKREKVSITYSSKTYVPDFTFDNLDLALEVKLCNQKTKEKTIIDEINADIPAYKTKYKRIIFVVYDLGFIRDVSMFKSGIEDNKDVYVVVVKK